MTETVEFPKTHSAINIFGSPRWNPRWKQATERESLGYCFDVVLVGNETDGYVASVAQLRGVVSEGDDAESAIRNLIEAFRATIETYIEDRMPIPWEKPRLKEPNEDHIRVAVNV